MHAQVTTEIESTVMSPTEHTEQAQKQIAFLSDEELSLVGGGSIVNML